jgi:flavin-dependent dehydrogenase
MKESYDVLVIGAGSAGAFFGKRMAEQGYSVLIADKSSEENLGSRLEIFHIDKDFFQKFNIPEPQPGDPDYVSLFEYGYARSAFDRYEKRTDYSFLVLKFPLFLKRLTAWAKESGAEYMFDCEFKDFLWENDKLSGARFRSKGKTIDIRARLIADCSGIHSPVRSALPSGYGVETFVTNDKEKFYVILRYVRLDYPEKDRVTRSIGYPYYKTWIAPQSDPDGAIIGVGANRSFEYAEECFQKFINAVRLPPYTLQKTEKGTTPYRRPPYSLVGDHFVVMGDSACITKPYSGEGVTASWILCDIAADVAGKALKNGVADKKALWEINTRYFHKQGADFANLLATLVGAVDCTAEENDYEFKHGIVFNSKDMTTMNRTFSADLSLPATLSLVAKVFWGLICGKIRLQTVRSLLKAVLTAGKLKAHYKAYPASPDDLPAWTEKADLLWKKAGSMAEILEKQQAPDK